MALSSLTPFGVEWDSLTLAHVRAFFADPAEESLTWEAKGPGVRREHVLNAASAFGNSDLGGYLVIGVDQTQKSRAWTLPGWAPNNPDPSLQVNQWLELARPRPPTDVRTFSLAGGNFLSIIRIWPASVPPVLTPTGGVWRRVSGESRQVTDPVEMRRLFDLGDAARVRISSESHAAAAELIGSPGAVIALGIAAASLPGDITPQVFREAFADALRSHALKLAMTLIGSGSASTGRSTLNQGGYTARANIVGDQVQVAIRARRHGGVAVALRSDGLDDGIMWARGARPFLEAMFDTLAAVLRDLDAKGRTHLAGYFVAPNVTLTAADSESDTGSDGREEVARILRDVSRGVEIPDWEP